MLPRHGAILSLRDFCGLLVRLAAHTEQNYAEMVRTVLEIAFKEWRNPDELNEFGKQLRELRTDGPAYFSVQTSLLEHLEREALLTLTWQNDLLATPFAEPFSYLTKRYTGHIKPSVATHNYESCWICRDAERVVEEYVRRELEDLKKSIAAQVRRRHADRETLQNIPHLIAKLKNPWPRNVERHHRRRCEVLSLMLCPYFQRTRQEVKKIIERNRNLNPLPEVNKEGNWPSADEYRSTLQAFLADLELLRYSRSEDLR